MFERFIKTDLIPSGFESVRTLWKHTEESFLGCNPRPSCCSAYQEFWASGQYHLSSQGQSPKVGVWSVLENFPFSLIKVLIFSHSKIWECKTWKFVPIYWNIFPFPKLTRTLFSFQFQKSLHLIHHLNSQGMKSLLDCTFMSSFSLVTHQCAWINHLVKSEND